MTDQIQIKLDDDALAKVVSAQILTTLSDETREQILQQAITYLVTPPKERGYSYGKRESPLQQAFNLAVAQLTRDLVHDYVAEHPEFRAAVESKIEEAAAAALANDEEMKHSIGEAVVSALYRKS